MAKFITNFGLIILLSFTIIGIIAEIEDNEIGEGVQMLGGVKVYKSEQSCAMVGGLCVQENDCVHKSTNSGLCPDNQYNGVECCYEPKIKPAPCAQHAGACMNRCHHLLQRPGTDCAKGEMCCVLV